MSGAGNSNPSLQDDPASDGSMGGVMRFILRKFLQSTDDMLPATVIATDGTYATVRPQIRVVGTDNTLTSRAQIAKVPIFFIGAGGFVLSFPVKEGDMGWIKASDRDISLYLQSNAEAAPNSQRMHSFSDGVFIPDAARKWTVASGESASAVLQSLDGTVYVAVGSDHVKIKAPTVTVDAPTTHLTGNLNVDGAIVATGNVTGGGKSLDTHIHSGVTTGGGNSGPPV